MTEEEHIEEEILDALDTLLDAHSALTRGDTDTARRLLQKTKTILEEALDKLEPKNLKKLQHTET